VFVQPQTVEHLIERPYAVNMVTTSGMSEEPRSLSPRQQQIMQAVREAIRLYGRMPTNAEIGSAVGLVSPSSVAYQLRQLVEKGALP
jgi:repressor LexA